MASDPKNPEVGEISVDATACLAYAVDLPPGGTVGMLQEHEGIGEVIAEIKAHQATWGETAGITALDLTTLMTADVRIHEIDNLLPAARKMVEILEETRAQQDDIRERTIRSIAHSVDTRARTPGNKALLAMYERTRSYRSQAAVKAAKTRRKNAAEKAAKKGNGAQNATQPATPSPAVTQPAVTQPAAPPTGNAPTPNNG